MIVDVNFYFYMLYCKYIIFTGQLIAISYLYTIPRQKSLSKNRA